MKDKKQAIQAAAMNVFSRKGYHAASIQEIAEEAGIAKGSVYLYFKSKDELAMSVMAYAHERIAMRMREVLLERGLSVRERVARQLEVQLRESAESAAFFLRLWSEQAISLNDDFKNIMLKARLEGIEWLHGAIIELYGDEAAPYAYDAALHLQGAIGEYMGQALFSGRPVPPGRLAAYLLERSDDLVAGMIRGGAEPLVGERDFRALRRKLSPEGENALAWHEEAGRLRRAIAELGEHAAAAELGEALAVLEMEMAKLEPRPVVLRGMLHVLRAGAPPALQPAVERLANAVH